MNFVYALKFAFGKMISFPENGFFMSTQTNSFYFKRHPNSWSPFLFPQIGVPPSGNIALYSFY